MADPLFDDPARTLRRRRALSRTDRPFLAERIVEEWRERLIPIARTFERGLVTGCPPALAADLEGVAKSLRFADSLDTLAEEAPESLDLIMIMGELDGRDALPTLLAIARSRLAPRGLLVGAFPGGQSLPALRAALHAADQEAGAFSARTHPRIEPGAFAHLLSEAGLVEPVVDIDRVRLRYRALTRLVGDLRDHGATNVLRARARTTLGRQRWTRAQAAFAGAARDGATDELIELVHFTAWAPDRDIRS